MNILFVHNNFPAQFRHVAQALARDPKAKVVAIGSPTARGASGVRLLKYSLNDTDVSATHPFARRFDIECRRAEQVLYGLSSLASARFVPDVVLAHPGWGEALPLRTIFPNARLLLYCEFYYGSEDRDIGFDPEFPAIGLDGHVSLHLKNATTLLGLIDCAAGVAPTRWQRSTFPREFQDKIAVIHEGIDVGVAKPAEASLRLSSGLRLSSQDEVVTFVARNLEPMRGYHVFMRALPRILAARPRCQVVIVGGDGTSYGASPPKGRTWKSIYLDEVADRIDPARVHFTGPLPYHDYLRVLQVSSAHIYLTYPFVLSWSLLEAMSAGCLVIASDTAPVQEVIDGNNGVLVPFFDSEQIAERVIAALARPHRFAALRERARETVIERFDLARKCLPEMLAFVRGKTARRTVGTAHPSATAERPRPRRTT